MLEKVGFPIFGKFFTVLQKTLMAQLTPLQLDDGTVIYIEAKEDVEVLPVKAPTGEETRELTREDLERGSKGLAQERVLQSFQAVEGTIRAYTDHTLKAFRHVANANIDKVTLEFGVTVGGKAGVPYVTEGTAESNLKITVECSFPNRPPQPEQQISQSTSKPSNS